MKNPMKCVPGGESGPSVSNQLEQMLMNARRPQNRDAAPPQRPAGGAIDMDTLQSILSDLSGGRGGAQGQAQGQAPAAQQAQQQQQQQRAPDVELTDLFSQESVRQVLSGEPASFEQRLSEHFPEGIETSVLEEIRTPQFRQSLELLQVCGFTLPTCCNIKKWWTERWFIPESDIHPHTAHTGGPVRPQRTRGADAGLPTACVDGRWEGWCRPVHPLHSRMARTAEEVNTGSRSDLQGTVTFLLSPPARKTDSRPFPATLTHAATLRCRRATAERIPPKLCQWLRDLWVDLGSPVSSTRV